MLMLKTATKQPHLSAIFHAQSFSLCDHTVWMPSLCDTLVLWLKIIQQDLKSNNLSLNEATGMAQNHPLWRLMSTFGAMES